MPIIIIYSVYSPESEPNITLYPAMITVYEGDTATFSCISYRFDFIQWAIDDASNAFLNYDDWVVTFDIDGIVIYSKLLVTGQMAYNNSIIYCIGHSLFGYQQTTETSNTGILLVQGIESAQCILHVYLFINNALSIISFITET